MWHYGLSMIWRIFLFQVGRRLALWWEGQKYFIFRGIALWEGGGNFLGGDSYQHYILWLRTIPGLLLNVLRSFGQRPKSKGCWLIKKSFCKSRGVFRSFFKHLWYILLKTLRIAFISYFDNWSKGIWDACLMQGKNK